MKIDKTLIARMEQMIVEALQSRGNLPRSDLEYLAEQTAKLKDERLKSCVADLIGWGDEERAKLETFCAITLEVMKRTTPSKLRECTRIVEIRVLEKAINLPPLID